MIRYLTKVGDLDLEAAVDQEKPSWRDRAKQRTESFLVSGKDGKKSSIWFEIKPVFMRFQHEKCGFCERQLATEYFGGSIEHDLEHFRPKSKISDWDHRRQFDSPMGDPSETGYFWLAYHLGNYTSRARSAIVRLREPRFPSPANGARPSYRPAS